MQRSFHVIRCTSGIQVALTGWRMYKGITEESGCTGSLPVLLQVAVFDCGTFNRSLLEL